MTAPRSRLRASLLLAALFAGGLIAGACHPTTYTPPIGTIENLQGEK